MLLIADRVYQAPGYCSHTGRNQPLHIVVAVENLQKETGLMIELYSPHERVQSLAYPPDTIFNKILGSLW